MICPDCQSINIKKNGLKRGKQNHICSDCDRQFIKGSHRQFKHPEKAGTVTVSGNLGVDMPIGTLKSVWRQAQLEEEED